MIDIDSLLLDRVFQPTADRLGADLSCFGLARLCLVSAAVMQFVVLAVDLQNDVDLVRRWLAVGITLLALVGAQQARHVIARAERQSQPGAMNVRRITMRWQRAAWLALMLWATAVALGQPTGANLAVCAASAAWLSCIYFLSCSPSPPMRRFSRTAHAFAR